MYYNGRFEHNNKVAREVCEEFAEWYEPFELALKYSDSNNSPYDIGLLIGVKTVFKKSRQAEMYSRCMYLLDKEVYKKNGNDENDFPSYDDWCDNNEYKKQ